MRFALLILIIPLLFSCSNDKLEQIEDLQLQQVFGNDLWNEVVSKDLKVFYFLAPECPLCQNYAKAMRDIQQANPEIEFIGIFPGEAYSNEEIRKYLFKFELDFNCYLDPDFRLTRLFKAEITPEAFLVNADGEILYSGAIDNWAISLGQKRSVITKKYLEDAIASAEKGLPADPKKSKAVGCFIE